MHFATSKSYRLITKCELSSQDKKQLHSRLAADLASLRKYESCRSKIEEDFDNRMGKLRIAAEYKKYQLDLLHERQKKVIELEILLLSDFLYKDYAPRRDVDSSKLFEDFDEESHHDTLVDQKRDDWNIWYPHPDRTDMYVEDSNETRDVLQRYILLHVFILVATWLQV